MPATDHYDVVIIGSGAGGGTLAWKLAPSGKRILLLERGDYLPRERDNWDTTAVFLQGKYSTDEEWRDRKGDEFTPDGCRLWDAKTGEKLDKDRFRRDLGSVIEHYREVGTRIGAPL